MSLGFLAWEGCADVSMFEPEDLPQTNFLRPRGFGLWLFCAARPNTGFLRDKVTNLRNFVDNKINGGFIVEKKTKRILIVGGILLAVLLLVFVGIRLFGQPRGATGAKTITLAVTADDATRSHTIQTDSQFLRGALEEQDLVAGTKNEFGLYVLTVDGITADESIQQWWRFDKNGEMLLTGVDETPIEDGDHFEATLITGWD
jgi:hypothetical protein